MDVIVCGEASGSTVESVCGGRVHIRMTGTVTLGRGARGRGLQNGEGTWVTRKGSEEGGILNFDAGYLVSNQNFVACVRRLAKHKVPLTTNNSRRLMLEVNNEDENVLIYGCTVFIWIGCED